MFLVVRDHAVYIHLVCYFKGVIFYCFPHHFKEGITYTICTRSFVGFTFLYNASQFVQWYRCVLGVRRILRELLSYTLHQVSKNFTVHRHGVEILLHIVLENVHYVCHRCVCDAVAVLYCLEHSCLLSIPGPN